ncbi:hypothetical protein C7999DRAFT_12219 [Corynascus novoguineensis]|uniref:Uncharacterized protein n=1 Tax=Corynascus novoguineensis TaxID=1126955 RepID=A0AAN7CXC8_9PEZI|nr:hypothetical protein C7999DRAFT_12219 [Corynascus novoguineensis]
MDKDGQRLPPLSQQELTNPYTRISLDGIEVQLWQVAHIYGVDHSMPSLSVRAGACSQDFRSLFPRSRGKITAVPDVLTTLSVCDVNTRSPFPDILTPTLSIPARRQVRHIPIQHPEESDSHDHDFGTNDVLRLIDEMIDEWWFTGGGEAETQSKTEFPAATLLETKPRIEGVIWANPSFSPPSHLPPNGPLPRVPLQLATDKNHGAHRARNSATLSRTACQGSTRAVGKLTENYEGNSDDDADSQRTVTPDTFIQQFVPAPWAHVSTSTALPKAERPVAVHSHGRATSASIFRNIEENHCPTILQKPELNGAQPEPAPPSLPHSLPDLLLSPPSLLRQRSNMPQQPHFLENQHRGVTTRQDTFGTFSTLVATVTRPVSPTSDEVAMTSRWSSDSEDDKKSKMKKLKKVLSFSRLRSGKSNPFQKQTGAEASKSAASVAKRKSDSLLSRKGSKSGN